jgi:leucyl-tRNA synthetase
MKYNFLEIEERWQRKWEQDRQYATPNPGDMAFDSSRPRFYVLDMFPYPSGIGLHVGHPLGYIGTDVVARYKRMCGYNVLHPMGYDSFGLPAENFAIEHGVHPSVTTKRNIDNITRQLKRLGLSYDWERCLSTTDPDFYRWTQWIFLQMYNSWFDPTIRQARPIGELVQHLEKGEVLVGPENALLRAVEATDCSTIREWASLSEVERDAVLGFHRLAYMDEVRVNWCPMLGTVLANEEVTSNGRSERGNYPVYRRPVRQWMLRITTYAERLIEELDLVDWPESIKTMQRNWVGKSEGASVAFPVIPDSPSRPNPCTILVFTTRPDTLFGATYIVLAPEHPLVSRITSPGQRAAVVAYQAAAAHKSDFERTELAKTKTGVFTGAYAVNPLNEEKIAIWIADYVLASYGTGAIMAVPAHDDRDFQFAKQFGLPIRVVITPSPKDSWWLERRGDAPTPLTYEEFIKRYITSPQEQPEAFSRFDEETIVVNSANAEVSLDKLSAPAAKEKITDWLEEKRLGTRKVTYKLRDWLFSRQRYWGEPFPILHGPEGEIVPLSEHELPVVLPPMEDFTPVASDDPNVLPVPPLSRAPDSWKIVMRNGVPYSRELNTMPQWAGSCWYYLRFLDPRNHKRLVSLETERYWMGPKQGNPAGGVDLYVGGAEHAVLHLLYARFWHKVLHDLGHVSTPEPFGRLFNQGYILAPAFQDTRGIYVPATQIDEKNGKYYYQGQEVNRKLGKMGKSLKNAVSPDDIIEQYGCDTLRLYEMYLGPLDQSKPWRTQDIVGVHRFLQRLWRLLVGEDAGVLISEDTAPIEVRRLTDKAVKRVTQAMESLAFNVAIAAVIELNNELVKRYFDAGTEGHRVPRRVAETLLLLLSPIAPHICEEIWRLLDHLTSISDEPWPSYDPALLAEEEVAYPVQVNGKLRHVVRVPADADDSTIETAIRADARVAELLAGKKVTRVIVVKGKSVNFVIPK